MRSVSHPIDLKRQDHSGLRPLVVIFLFLILFFGSFACADLQAQTAPVSDRKKIGLVLSGGGARGAAHVGVIKVLEELQVPIDYIVGTSLGSVVGALYALGKTPDELLEILETIDWNKGFVDELPRRRLPMRRKDERDQFLINFELGVRDMAFSLPRGVIQGHSLHLLLKSLIGGAALVDDFDKLPIPFRAIATDVEKSKTVVLGSGDLAKALQASMSIPGIYSPVVIDDQLLVDGGVTNNLPIDVVRDMGADIVIAVDISTPLAEQESLKTVVDIVDQLTNILTRANVEQRIASLGEEDIYIQPDLTGFSASDFARTRAIVDKGEQIAWRFSKDIKRLSLPRESIAEFRKKRNRVPGLPRRIGSIFLQQNSGLADSTLLSRAGFQTEAGFNLEDFHAAIDSIYSSGVFERVDYFYSSDSLVADEKLRSVGTESGFAGSGGSAYVGSADIRVEAVEKTWGPDVVRFGFTLEDDFGGRNNFNLSAGYTRKAINRLGGDIRLVGQIGEIPRFLTEYFQPFDDNADYYALLAFDHQQYSRGVFTGDTQTGDFRLRRNQLGAYLGRQISNRADLRAGVQFGLGRIKRRVGDVSLAEDEDFTEGAFQIEMRHDTLDSIKFPSRGSLFSFRFESSLELLNSDEEYDAIELEALAAYRKGPTRLVLSAVLKSVTRNDVPVQKAFSQGSLLSTSGLKRNVEVGQHAGRASLVVYRPLSNESIAALEYPIYFGSTIELGRVFQSRDDIETENLLLSGTLFAAADTPLGPLYLGVGASQGEGVSGLLSLGLTF